MEDTHRAITIFLKLFTGAFPERISLTLSSGGRVRDLMARVERKSFEGMSRKYSSLSLQDMEQDDPPFDLERSPDSKPPRL